MDIQSREQEALLFWVLSCPARKAILELLACRQAVRAMDIANKLAELGFALEQSTVASHLRILIERGFVEKHRISHKEVYYRLKYEPFIALMDAITTLVRGAREEVVA